MCFEASLWDSTVSMGMKRRGVVVEDGKERGNWGESSDFDKCRLKGHFGGGKGVDVPEAQEGRGSNQLSESCTGFRGGTKGVF